MNNKQLLPVAIALLTSQPILASVSSSFDVDSENWQIVSFADFSQNNYSIIGQYQPSYVSGGGNRGNYLAANDPDGGDFTFSAPAAFLGAQTSATGLSYDLTYRDGDVNWQTTDVMLVGNGQRLLWKRDPNIVPNSGWTHIVLNFAPSSEWRLDTTDGVFASQSDFHNVLSDLSGLYIHGEYTNGIFETAGLDNVVLQTVPLPGAFWLFGVGFAGFWSRIRRS
ncbi:PEP-CTERM sorting domain-containing protein [Methylomonas sp. LW13]|uniref:laminin B domain-containing protein n=1 Tax=unclassified Methylomonas TaxID=2608980 RepID=UPI00051AB09F|nr:laminin B domain-containing protein [Methylomonas sp. LW13]QBC29309.1 PEP-CTERM sorting domain-containing protein [Methylomonas sp. LW13]